MSLSKRLEDEMNREDGFEDVLENEQWPNEETVATLDEEFSPLPPTSSSSTYDYDDSDEIDLDFDAPAPRCAFLTGAAGTGKTYQVRERIASDPSEGLLCATTAGASITSHPIHAPVSPRGGFGRGCK